jgi:hypothetical protein
MSSLEAAEKVRLSTARLPALCSICWDDRVMQGFERPDRGLWDVASQDTVTQLIAAMRR